MGKGQPLSYQHNKLWMKSAYYFGKLVARAPTHHCIRKCLWISAYGLPHFSTKRLCLQPTQVLHKYNETNNDNRCSYFPLEFHLNVTHLFWVLNPLNYLNTNHSMIDTTNCILCTNHNTVLMMRSQWVQA